jgi:hypothetical protein
MGSGRNKICGATGIIDFLKYLSSGGVVERFKDIEFFKSFKIHEELGVLPCGKSSLIDIHPEHLQL